MIFTYRKWARFCRDLQRGGRESIPAREVTGPGTYLVLKHDVETKVKKAYRIARIEQKHGHRGSYYVQAYLLRSTENIALLREMQAMGHEISYHYDVLDATAGDLTAAMTAFENNKRLFEQNGFLLSTVCQHGNPIAERVGYTSNRDFFRADAIQKAYPSLCDIMVDFSCKHSTSYLYFSDAGHKFQKIFDPLTNDVTPSDDKNIPYKNLSVLYGALSVREGNIVSIHPHRWSRHALVGALRFAFFRCVRAVAKVLIKIPFMKKFMSKYYYLAKKM